MYLTWKSPSLNLFICYTEKYDSMYVLMKPLTVIKLSLHPSMCYTVSDLRAAQCTEVTLPLLLDLHCHPTKARVTHLTFICSSGCNCNITPITGLWRPVGASHTSFLYPGVLASSDFDSCRYDTVWWLTVSDTVKVSLLNT